jgi:hypothetical protein
MSFRYQESKLSYGSITRKGIKYSLTFGHPKRMLEDKDLSWDAKGRLSYCVFVSNDIPISKKIFDELLKFGYLEEVKDE